jgi:RNA polymerase sigma-70 factor, ECF subfamily
MSDRIDCAERYLGALHSTHYEPLLGFVTHIVFDDPQAAEDVVQETFLRAWQHAEEVAPETAAPWLFTVARRLAISAHRRRQRRRESLMAATDSVVFDDAWESVLDSLVVATGLQALTDRHRRVLQELYFERRTVAESARILGVPEGTVKSRSYYALRALRDALEERGVFHP